MRSVLRSVTSADPSGRNATAQGTRRPVATTVATTLGGSVSGAGVAVRLGVGSLGGPPPSASGGGPKEHPARLSTSAAAARRGTRGEGEATRTSLARPPLELPVVDFWTGAMVELG